MDKTNLLIVAAIVLVISLITGYTVSAEGLECPICDVDLAGYTGELGEGEIDGLLLALNDEYHAWAVYDQVLADFGDVRPFSQIVRSEATHIAALVELFDAYDVPVPENSWVGNVPSFESVQDAAAAAVQAEIDNVALYDVINDSSARDDILDVYASLQRASQDSHLPAFQRVADRGAGDGYGAGNGRGQGTGLLSRGARPGQGLGRGPGNETPGEGYRDASGVGPGYQGGQRGAGTGYGLQGSEDGRRAGVASSTQGGNRAQSLWDTVRGWFGNGQ